MIASMLSVSQPVDISYNVGIMPHNHATLDGGQDLRRRKQLVQKREAERGSWRTMRKYKPVASSHCLDLAQFSLSV